MISDGSDRCFYCCFICIKKKHLNWILSCVSEKRKSMIKQKLNNKKKSTSQKRNSGISGTFSSIHREEEQLNPPIFDLPTVSFEDKMVGLLNNVIGSESKNQKVLGIILMAAAGLFLTLGNSLVQFVYMENPDVHISSFQTLFVRSLVQLFFTVLFMIYGKIHPYGNEKKNIWLLCIMGIVEAAAIVLIYSALEKIPVGDATVIQFTAPIFTMIFSAIISKACCGWIDAICGAISFVGVIFIAKPSIIEGNKETIYFHHHHNFHQQNTTDIPITSMSADYLLGAGFALCAAVCLSWFYILNKMIGKRTDVTLTIFYPSIFGMVIAPIFMGIKGEKVIIHEINSLSWGLLFVVGFVAFIGLMFMAEALQLEKPGPAVLTRNLDPIYAFVFQYLFVHHAPGLAALLGTLIILTCSSIIAVNRIFGLEKKCRKKDDIDETDEEFLLTDPTAGDVE